MRRGNRFAAFALLAIGSLIVRDEAARSEAAESPSYHRHVAALFGKLGCNGGTCHGAVKGQNGFRLSMFGADPVGDHRRLLREFGSRRLDFVSPESSLLLLKGTGTIPHAGGSRMSLGSADYVLLRDWIAAGAPADDPAPARLKSLRIEPAERVAPPRETYRLSAKAEFADGRIEDVTAFCSFSSLDKSTATVAEDGTVSVVGIGDAAFVVRYRDQPALARVLVPRPGSSDFPDVRPQGLVDEHVLAKLRRLNLPPAAVCDDAVFLRRLHLDVLGSLPTPDEVRAFLADASPDKRRAEIERCLARPGHADLWTLKFMDLLKGADFGVYADAMSKEHDAPRMQAWIRARLGENVPYDEFVERILLATSREGRTMPEYADEVLALFEGYAPGRPDLELYAQRRTLDLFWQRRGSDGVKGTLQVAHAFLGLRLECAQCHRHPHDEWQTEDLLDFANLFMRVRTVGFQGDNEKKFADAAEFFRRFNDEAKTLDADVKKRKEGEGKKHDEEAVRAKKEIDRLNAEIAALEKKSADAGQVEARRKELDAAKESAAKAEAYREETARLEKRAKMLPEVARRLMQAESRLLPAGANAKSVSTLGTYESKTFRLLGESEPVQPPADSDPRALVVQWMRRPDNPWFARAIVNRVWAHYFGRGLVDPPDDLSAHNPATHPELLRALCEGFVRNKYDLRWLHRTILESRTWQQSSVPAEASATDRTHYAAFPLRRLSAEVLLDALDSATGTTENMGMKYHHWPETTTAVRIPFAPQNPFVAFVLENYGRPQRNAAVQCDCERDGSPSIFQVLTLANHPRVWEKIRDPGGRAARLAAGSGDVDGKLDELFLAVVSRFPSDVERTACREFVAASETPEKGLHNVLWSLINTREFLLQH